MEVSTPVVPLMVKEKIPAWARRKCHIVGSYLPIR